MKMHSCVTLDFVEHAVSANVEIDYIQGLILRALLKKPDGLQTSRKEALEQVAAYRKQGLKYWPDCGATRPDGHCAGHDSPKVFI